MARHGQRNVARKIDTAILQPHLELRPLPFSHRQLNERVSLLQPLVKRACDAGCCYFRVLLKYRKSGGG